MSKYKECASLTIERAGEADSYGKMNSSFRLDLDSSPLSAICKK